METNSPQKIKKHISEEPSSSTIKSEKEVNDSEIPSSKIYTTTNHLLNASSNRKNLNKNFSLLPNKQTNKTSIVKTKTEKNSSNFKGFSPEKKFKNQSYSITLNSNKELNQPKSPNTIKQINTNFLHANKNSPKNNYLSNTKNAQADNNKFNLNKNNNLNNTNSINQINNEIDNQENEENEGNEGNEGNEENEENEENEGIEVNEENEVEDFVNLDEPQIDSEFDKELLEAFREVDEDGSGTISKEEFGNFMRKLGYRPTIVELQEMIDEIDKDKSGQIGFDEFKLIMTKTIKDEFTINSSLEAFAFFDKNKTEKFSKNGLLNILLTKGDNQYSENELNDLLKYVDFDENDEVNYRDFILETFNSFKY